MYDDDGVDWCDDDGRVRDEWIVLAVEIELSDDNAIDFLVVVDDAVLREVERFSIVGAVVVEEE